MNRPIIIGICFIATAVSVIVFSWPQYQILKGKQAQAEAERFVILDKKTYYDKLVQISEELEKHSESISKIDSALPSEVSAPSIFDFFQRKTSESGLVFKDMGSISVNPSPTDPRIKEYTLNLNVSGSYGDFKNFISVLEKSARIIEVENISFSSPSGAGSIFSFSATVKFYSY